MPNFVRTRLLALVVAIPATLALQTSVSAQEPNLEVFYRKLEPKELFKYKWKGKEGVRTAGVLHWEVPESEFGTNGLDRNFTGYCAQVFVTMQANKSYSFKMATIYSSENYNVGDSPTPDKAAVRRVKYIQELFGRYYRDPIRKAVDPEEAVALQIALWKIIQEKEPAEGEELNLDLSKGDFQANYGGECEEAPAFVKTAQNFLNSLSGDDSKYFENPDLKGRELIRLKGIPNANGEVAQSQFALRFAGGGGVGSPNNIATALTTGAGLGTGTPGTGSPAAGVGTGGSGFLNTNSGNGTTTTPPTTTPPPVTTPPTQPPINTPPVGGPPDTPPDTPNNPVPAPAGLLLGAIALGTVGAWRIGVRLLSSK